MTESKEGAVPLSSSIRLLYRGATLPREAWSSPDSSLIISRLFLVLDIRDLRGKPSMKAPTTPSQRVTKRARAGNYRGNATWQNEQKNVSHPPLPPPASSQENENSSPPTSLRFNNTSHPGHQSRREQHSHVSTSAIAVEAFSLRAPKEF